MLMFGDIWEGGVDMGRGLQIFFVLLWKRDMLYVFRQIVNIFNIFVYVNNMAGMGDTIGIGIVDRYFGRQYQVSVSVSLSFS